MPASAIPRLQTSLTGPLLELEKVFLSRQYDIEHWFHQTWLETPAPFYTSVDLRNSGFKVAPVDTNLFPAGFNNLHPDSIPLSLPALESAVMRFCPTANKVLIIPENHTRNTFYLDSIAQLKNLLCKAGFRVQLGSLDPNLETTQSLTLTSGEVLHIHPIQREDYLSIELEDESFMPCAILLNNDLSSGKPEILTQLVDQYVIPPLELGWHSRTKQSNFNAYNTVSQSFSEMLGIDPWLVSTLYAPNELAIDFRDSQTTDVLQDATHELLVRIQKKYDEYQIKQKPYVMLKARSGTYGMGVIAVNCAKDLAELNRKQRKKMNVGKEGVSISHVVAQEGVPTFETVGADNSVAEPVIYMINHYIVGGFYRIHSQKGHNDNLNAPGMHFSPLPLAEPLMSPDANRPPDDSPNRFYAYGVTARLAMAAAALEIAKAQ